MEKTKDIIKSIREFKSQMDKLTLSDLRSNPDILEELTKLNVFIEDFLGMLAPKKRPLYLRGGKK